MHEALGNCEVTSGDGCRMLLEHFRSHLMPRSFTHTSHPSDRKEKS